MLCKSGSHISAVSERPPQAREAAGILRRHMRLTLPTPTHTHTLTHQHTVTQTLSFTHRATHTHRLDEASNEFSTSCRAPSIANPDTHSCRNHQQHAMMKKLSFEEATHAQAGSPHKVQLALDIINEHFGDITHDVAHVVAHSERPNLAHIVRALNNSYKPVGTLAFGTEKSHGRNGYSKSSGAGSGAGAGYSRWNGSTQRLELTQIREALLILYQHNCLLVSLPDEMNVAGDAPAVAAEKIVNQKGLIYHLNIDNILNRLRFGKLLLLVKSIFGDVGVVIMEELIDHGKLTPREIRVRALRRLESELHAAQQQYELAQEQVAQDLQSTDQADKAALQLLPTAAQEALARGAVSEAVVKERLEQIIQRRLIVSVTTVDFKKKLAERKAKASQLLSTAKSPSFTGMPAVASTAAASSQASGRTVITKQKRKFQELDTSADQLPGDSFLPLEMRMTMSLSVATASSSSAAGASSPELGSAASQASQPAQRSETRPNRGRGRGRGASTRTNRSADGMDVVSGPAVVAGQESVTSDRSNRVVEGAAYYGDGPREDVLWTVGWEQFFREQRHALCVSYVCERMEALAAKIVQLILQQSLPAELTSCESFSHKVGLTTIHELLRAGNSASKVIDPYSVLFTTDSSSHAKNRDSFNSADFSQVDLSTLQTLLEVLRTDSTEIINKVGTGKLWVSRQLMNIPYQCRFTRANWKSEVHIIE
jgi:ABC-type transporter Mla MlaB component